MSNFAVMSDKGSDSGSVYVLRDELSTAPELVYASGKSSPPPTEQRIIISVLPL